MPAPISALQAGELIRADYAGHLPHHAAVSSRGVQCSAVTARGYDDQTVQVVIVRGSDEASDWRDNLSFLPRTSYGAKWLWHRGFLRHAEIAYGFLAGLPWCDVVIGHSLGAAAMQIVCASTGLPGIGIAAPRPYVGLYPPPADIVLYNRVDDPVCRVPWWGKALGRTVMLHPVSSQIGSRHRIKDYLPLLPDRP